MDAFSSSFAVIPSYNGQVSKDRWWQDYDLPSPSSAWKRCTPLQAPQGQVNAMSGTLPLVDSTR
jgi:hypothetical protein